MARTRVFRFRARESHSRGSQSDAARPGVLLAIDYPDFQRRGAPLSVAIIGTTAIIGAAKHRKLVSAAREVFGVRPQRGVKISEAIVQRILVSVKRGHTGSGEAGKWFFRVSTAEILRAAPEAILDINRATAGGGRRKNSEWKLLDEPNEGSSILGRRMVRS